MKSTTLINNLFETETNRVLIHACTYIAPQKQVRELSACENINDLIVMKFVSKQFKTLNYNYTCNKPSRTIIE